MAQGYADSVETYVRDIATKTDANVIKLFYSGITAVLAYFCITPVAAAAGVAVFYLLSITRYSKAFWAVAVALFTYKSNKNLFYCFVALAAFLYVKN
jgi:hypothetical protein